MQDPVYTITIDPSPLTQGKTGKINYSGPDGTVITLDWGDTQVQVTIQRGKATFTVPQNASSLIASDPWGNTGTTTCGP